MPSRAAGFDELWGAVRGSERTHTEIENVVPEHADAVAAAAGESLSEVEIGSV